ncbi:hypothetical protein QYE76_065853 [Lolium multiflorum]|uniref:Uncharacterized protein n=1 Tax=Lolium multiflorum TaxID=4521 RepID=A0AAD8W996_LOLMU|nr:hypothetical protein QYE76_065853 [Lolium multiflorum]
MENYSLLMGDTAVMKMAVVSMEEPSGGTSPSGVPNRDSCPRSWLCDGGGSGRFLVPWLFRIENIRQLHEDMRTLVLEQKAKIERLYKKEAEDRQAITILETRLKNNEEQLAKRPSIDDISAKLKVLESKHESLKQSLKESHESETKTKKELEDKHAQGMAEMAEKLKTCNNRVKSLSTKLKAAEAEAADVDELIFPCLGFEWREDSGLSRTEAYEEAQNSIDDLIESCHGIAQKLSLKKARTSIIDKMTKLVKMMLELIEDWQDPQGHNVKQALAETQGFDTLFARRVDHLSWYKKHDVPTGFFDDEEDDEVEGKAEGKAEGSGSSAHQSDDDSGDGSGKDNTYQASEDKPESSE